mgnify:CR=1 FL=1
MSVFDKLLDSIKLNDDDYDEDNYYCGLSEKYTYTIGAEPHTYRTIKSAYKKGDEIAIYDYFLRTINDDCFTSYMKDEKDETCGKALENKKEVDYKFLKKYVDFMVQDMFIYLKNLGIHTIGFQVKI